MKDTLTCKNCKTETSTRHCPNCGMKLIIIPKTAQEIEFMQNLVGKAIKIIFSQDREMRPVYVTLQMALNCALSWATGESDMSPLELVVHGEEKRYPKLKILLDAQTLKNTQQESEEGKN